MTDNIPAVFSDKGVFQELDDAALAGLSQLQAAAYLALADAAHELAAKDQAVAAAQDRVTNCIRDLREAQQYLTDNYPKITFQDLWRENFGRK